MKNQRHESTRDLVGDLERITYHDEASGFTIAQVRVPNNRNTVTLVGTLMEPVPGTVVKAHGRWTDHPKFGRQFKAANIETRPPVSIQGIEKFLASGLIKGIGPETARRIVERFQDQTLDIIEHQPDRLAEVPGIGAKRVAMIQKAWQEQRQGRDVLLFLQSHGVTPAYAFKIFRQYGRRTIEVVRKNPYRLASDIFGIGFLIADDIAAKLGFDNHAPMRLQAGILYVLHQLADKGHLFFPYEELIAQSRSILKSPRDPIVSALATLAVDKKVVMVDLNASGEQPRPNHKAVYLSQYYICEGYVAKKLHMLMTSPNHPLPVDAGQAVEWVQAKFGLELAGNQRQAVSMAMTSKVLVITGGPGTGKTTIVRAITRLYEHMHSRVLLAAPTGRAAKRLSEATGRKAKTIHRLLKYNPSQGGFHRNKDHPLDGDLLVVDEASMIDAVLMHHLLKALPVASTLILVGDVNQLPSVGPGNVLKDILSSGAVANITLSQIFRQARDSRIIVNAHRINSGKMPLMKPEPSANLEDFYFIAQEDPEKVLETILTLASERIPRRFGFDAIGDIQVLTPMHRGVIGAHNLNLRLQQTLNPQESYVSRGEQRFSANDKVMQIRNNYEKQIFNGDIGRIAHIDPSEKSVGVRFDDRMVAYAFEEMDEVVLAYAISVHKSQGSEYPAVVIPVTTGHYLLLQRNLIYTGITRAKKLVVLVGTRQALAMAVRNNTPHLRHTRLAHRLITFQSP